jgi:hypothetical protein
MQMVREPSVVWQFGNVYYQNPLTSSQPAPWIGSLAMISTWASDVKTPLALLSMLIGKTHSFLAALALLFGVSAAWAEDMTHERTTVAGLAYQIEIARHQRLADVRASPSVRLEPFKSDGCSGGLSAGWDFLAQALPELARRHGDQPPWQHCCVTHDQAYHVGGGRHADARASYVARRRADEQLRQCVLRTGKKRISVLMNDYSLSREQASKLYRGIADAMYQAVRVGGIPCTGLPWRWGFGWPRCDLPSPAVQH